MGAHQSKANKWTQRLCAAKADQQEGYGDARYRVAYGLRWRWGDAAGMRLMYAMFGERNGYGLTLLAVA